MDEFLKARIAELKQKKLVSCAERPFWCYWEGDFINFSSNDYLGLAQDERVVAAGVAAAQKYGAGGQASRIAGGNHPLYDELEASLAHAKGAEAACVFGSGYLANLGTISALMSEGDLILADKLAHSCLLEGAQLSGAKLMRFKHNCTEHLQALLQKERGNYRNCLVLTEEIFSMDGDFGRIEEISQLCKAHDAWLLVDGAHSSYEMRDERYEDIYVGTLSKALGGYGGYVCGSKTLVEFIKTSAKTLIYSTALPPFVLGAAIEALKLAPEKALALRANIDHISASHEILRCAPNNEQSHIIPIIIGDEMKTLAAAEKLKEQGILVAAIRPPTVPANTSRLRISLSVKHTEADLLRLKTALKAL